MNSAVVLGGGPSGCTVSTLLARAGWRVTMVDQHVPPVAAVGESLLPICVPVLRDLGVDMGGFQEKRGAVFLQGDRAVRFDFADALRDCPPLAWHTPRDQLDQRMREVALAAGVTLHHARVTGVELPGQVRTDTGLLHGDWIIDAGGRGQLLAKQLGIRRYNQTLRHAALSTHFRGVRRSAHQQDGDVLLSCFEGGWFWIIPFSDGRFSVGIVTTPKGPRGPSRWEEALCRCPAAAALLRDAEPLAPFRGAQDFTVEADRFHGDGWALVGDAATFLDPIFSTGIAMALVGGQELASGLIRGDSLDAYEATVRRASECLTPAVESFYDGTFLQVAFSPRERQNETIRRAIVSLLAGDVFDASFDVPARFARRMPSLARMTAHDSVAVDSEARPR